MHENQLAKYCILNNIKYEILKKIHDATGGGSAWIAQYNKRLSSSKILVVIFVLPPPIDTHEYNVKMRFFGDLSRHKSAVRDLLNHSKLPSNLKDNTSIVTIWKYKKSPFFSHIHSMDNHLDKIIKSVPSFSAEFSLHTTCNFFYDMGRIFSIAREHYIIHGELLPNNILIHDTASQLSKVSPSNKSAPLSSKQHLFYLRAADAIFTTVDKMKEPRGDHFWVCLVMPIC